MLQGRHHQAGTTRVRHSLVRWIVGFAMLLGTLPGLAMPPASTSGTAFDPAAPALTSARQPGDLSRAGDDGETPLGYRHADAVAKTRRIVLSTVADATPGTAICMPTTVACIPSAAPGIPLIEHPVFVPRAMNIARIPGDSSLVLPPGHAPPST